MKLMRISLTLSSKEVIDNTGFSIVEFDITKDTDKTVFVYNEGSQKKLKILKNNILRIDTIFREDLYNIITYSIYCYDTDLNKAKQMLIDKISEEVDKRKKSVEILVKNLESIK
jgi:tmRNA-binding protein